MFVWFDFEDFFADQDHNSHRHDIGNVQTITGLSTYEQ